MAPFSMGGGFWGQVESVSPLSPEVVRVTVAADAAFSWSPGQHIALRARGQEVSPCYYSIASADLRDKASKEAAESARFELAVNAASAKLGRPLSEGLELEISKPGGGPALSRLRAARHVCLIGIGTGIAPLRAVVQALLDEKRREEKRREGVQSDRAAQPGPQVTLLQGAKTLDRCLFLSEMSQAPGLQYHPILSRTGEGQWTGRTGHVQDHVAELCPSESEFCVCGSKSMVAEVSAQLAELGVPAARIFAEGY